MRTTKRSTKFAALAVGLALVAGACGGDDDGGGDTPSETTGGASDTTVASGETEPTETTGGGDTTQAAGEAGGTVTYAAEQEFTSYNNGAADQGLFANTLVLNMTLPGPYIFQPDLSAVLFDDMMESAEVISEDPQVIEYVVKEAAVWSDGEPIDCDDFYLSWMSGNGKQSDPNPDYTGPDQVDAEGNPVPETLPHFNPASTTGSEDISSVECSEDGRTITVTFETVFADWQTLFGGLLPAHIVEQGAGVEDITTVDGNTASAESKALGEFWNTGFVGFDPAIAVSGAWYVIDSFEAGQSLILKRNEAYYGEPGKVDEIVFQQVPDATQQPAALENGDVQVISPQPNPDLVAQLEAITGVTTSLHQGVTFEHYDFNQANPHLAKLEVRQALATCINREEIVETLVAPINPDATVLNNRMYIPDSPDYADNSNGLVQDIDAAKALLESVGYVLGADGIYEHPTDGRLSLRLGRRDPNPRRQDTNRLFAEQCLPAGVELTDDAAEDFNAVRLPASDYDIALFAWVASPALSGNTSIYVPGGGQNWNAYNNPEVQTLFDQANAELSDVALRADLMNQIDALIWEDMATLPLFQFQELIAYSDDVQNVSFNGPFGVTWDANNWALAS